MLYIDPVGQYAKLTYGLLSPFIEAGLRERLIERKNELAIQRAKELAQFELDLKKQLEQERLNRIQELANQLVQGLPSPANTYVLGSPSFSLPEPTLDISPVPSVREQIGEGLLGDYSMPSIDLPDRAEFVSTLMSPTEYQGLLFQKTLPQMAMLVAEGVNVSPLITSLAKTQAEMYKAREEEAKRLQEERKSLAKLQVKFNNYRTNLKKVAKKYGAGLSPDELDAWALNMAMGEVKLKDFVDTFKRNVSAERVVNPKTGDAVIVYTDKNTGGVVRTIRIPTDMDKFKAMQEVKAGHGRGGSKSYQWKTIEVPYTPEEIKQLPKEKQLAAQMGFIKKEKVIYFDPKTKKAYDPITGAEVDPNTGEPLVKIRPKQLGQRSVLDLYPDLGGVP